MKQMDRFTGTLRTLIKTSLIISNREAPHAFLSYLAYAMGGLIFSITAIIPVVLTSSKAAADAPLIFLVVVAMFDYLNIQTFLTHTTLTSRSELSLFPFSGLRSIVYRFILMLLNKRILFYVIPMIVESAALMVKGEVGAAAIAVLLYVFLYVIMSEMLFFILPRFRALAERYSVRTAMQIAILPVLGFLFTPGIFHIRPEIVLRIPVASQFVRGGGFAVASDFVPAAGQVGELALISLVFGAAASAVGLLLLRIRPVASPFQAATALAPTGKRVSGAGAHHGKEAAENEEVLPTEISPDAGTARPPQRARRLVFLDWKMRQREEKLLSVMIISPFLALLLAESIVPALHWPLVSVILPIFLVVQFAGIPLIDQSFTHRGLRLKHVATLPVSPAAFVRFKSFSAWILIVLAALFVTILQGLRWQMSYYQEVQGIVFSMFISSILIIVGNTFVLDFNWISRHPLISIPVLLTTEMVATLIYAFLMLFSFPVGLAFVVVLFALTYFCWVPAWGKRLASEFQALIDESE